MLRSSSENCSLEQPGYRAPAQRRGPTGAETPRVHCPMSVNAPLPSSRDGARAELPTTAPTEAEIVELLRAVIDPELGADIVSLGMVPHVRVVPTADGGVDVTVGVKLTI